MGKVEAHVGEMEGERVLPVAQPQPPRNPVVVGRSVHQQTGNHQPSGTTLQPCRVGIEAHDAVVGGKHQRAVGQAARRVLAVHLAQQIVRQVIVLKLH